MKKTGQRRVYFPNIINVVRRHSYSPRIPYLSRITGCSVVCLPSTEEDKVKINESLPRSVDQRFDLMLPMSVHDSLTWCRNLRGVVGRCSDSDVRTRWHVRKPSNKNKPLNVVLSHQSSYPNWRFGHIPTTQGVSPYSVCTSLERRHGFHLYDRLGPCHWFHLPVCVRLIKTMISHLYPVGRTFSVN